MSLSGTVHGTNNGWTYDSSTGTWSDTSTGGYNFTSASEQVTEKYVSEVSGGAAITVPEITVTNPAAQAAGEPPLELIGANPLQPTVAVSPATGFMSPATNTELNFGVVNPVTETYTTTVSASSTALSISSPTAATASLNNVEAATTQPVGATFSPIQSYSASARTFSPTGLTINFVNAQGNPALNAWVSLDGAAQLGSTPVADGASIAGGALWLTSIDGTSLTTLNTAGTSVPDAFPLVNPMHKVSNYQAPLSSSMFYPVVTSTNTLMKVNTGPNGSVTVGLRGAGADYYTGTTYGQSVPLSSSKTYFLGVWNPNVPTGYDAYLNAFPVGNAGTMAGIHGMGSLTATTYDSSTYVAASATLTITDPAGNPVTGLTASDLSVTSTGTVSGTYSAVSTAPTTPANDFTLKTTSTAGSYTITVYSTATTWGTTTSGPSTISVQLSNNEAPFTSNINSGTVSGT